MANALRSGEWDGVRNGEFLRHVGEHMHRWLACLAAIDGTIDAPVPADD